ncbi:hypothetical protein B0H14DRAFT_2566955 [Mycena olivaceomarginata]|nr:hypothetical protein B0H14DRAFT_2566955 [Mycena olivaceomarginata]
MAPSISFTFPETPPSPTSLAYLLDHHSTAPLSRTESDIANSYIDELESRIALLDEAIASLQLRRADLLQSVNTHKAILAPVRRLPSEILGEIFSLVVSATFQVQLPPTGKTLDAPWLFTRICRRWSAVALATPALWSTVFLHLDCDGTQGSISLTNLCFQRSGNLPLTINIVQESGTRDSHPLLDVALLSSERWKIADLYMAFPLFQQITKAHSSLPSLTTLLISIESRNDWRSHETFLKTFAVAPKLKDVKAISWGEGGFMAAPFTLPWDQLTRVSATFASTLEALPVFRKLSHIVECKFTFAKSEALPIDYSTIRLPHLCSLALKIESDDPDDDPDMHEPNSLLDFLQTPCLRSLTTYETAKEEAVLGLITRSDCAASLASFHFHSISINHKDAASRIARIWRLQRDALPRVLDPDVVTTVAARSAG